MLRLRTATFVNCTAKQEDGIGITSVNLCGGGPRDCNKIRPICRAYRRKGDLDAITFFREVGANKKKR
jgi:hypothetical protein